MTKINGYFQRILNPSLEPYFSAIEIDGSTQSAYESSCQNCGERIILKLPTDIKPNDYFYFIDLCTDCQKSGLFWDRFKAFLRRLRRRIRRLHN